MFDTKWFKDPHALHYVCAVCLGVCKETITSGCGHPFCKDCAVALDICPVCRGETPEWDFNRHADRVIRSLKFELPDTFFWLTDAERKSLSACENKVIRFLSPPPS